MEPVETRKGRGSWKHWTGTPSDLCEVAQLALDLVQRENAKASMKMTASATARPSYLQRSDGIHSGPSRATTAQQSSPLTTDSERP